MEETKVTLIPADVAVLPGSSCIPLRLSWEAGVACREEKNGETIRLSPRVSASWARGGARRAACIQHSALKIPPTENYGALHLLRQAG